MPYIKTKSMFGRNRRKTNKKWQSSDKWLAMTAFLAEYLWGKPNEKYFTNLYRNINFDGISSNHLPFRTSFHFLNAFAYILEVIIIIYSYGFRFLGTDLSKPLFSKTFAVLLHCLNVFAFRIHDNQDLTWQGV